jgi:EAL domain-containing protein (putative c-di-GMP-specific phosphodiesterase class I)
MTADMGWSRRIKHAIDNGRFALACQPIVSTQDRTLESFEVLIRMLDEDESLIMPGGFLATAERFGFANDIDRWVIVHGIDKLIEQRRTAPNARYSINLSAQTLSDPSICDFIVEKLETSGLDPTALTFEITETAAIADMNVAAKLLSRLQRIGCKIALDDFGSCMPSFAYLKNLPVDIVKIDGHFVKQLAENPVDQAIVKGMNEIVHALGKKTVAEFVENEESFRLLGVYGVDYAQGYYLGRPELKG